MTSTLQHMAENGKQFLEELHEIFASFTSVESSSGSIGAFPTTIRSNLPQQEHDLSRESQELLSCVHHQPPAYRNGSTREEPALIIPQQQQQDPLPSSLNPPHPENLGKYAGWKIPSDVEEGDFNRRIAAASMTTRMDKDPFEFGRKTAADVCAGENDNEFKIDPTPGNSGEVFPLSKIHNQIIPSTNSVDKDDKPSHVCTPLSFGGSISEAKVKEAMWIFIIAVKGGVCMSLEIAVGIMVDNQLLKEFIRHGLTSEAYRLVEEMSHNTYTSWDVIRWLAYEDLGEDTHFEQKVYLQYVIDKAKTGKDAGIIHKMVLDDKEGEVVLGRLLVMVKSLLASISGQNDCFYDSGGYFLIKCAEDPFTPQEQRYISRLWITDKSCWTTQFLSEIERRSVHIKLLESSKGGSNNGGQMIRLYFSYATISIWIMFFALGVSSDSEVFEMIDLDFRNADVVLLTTRDADEVVRASAEVLKLVSLEINSLKAQISHQLNLLRSTLINFFFMASPCGGKNLSSLVT